MITESLIDIRYPDCDPMNVVHHAVYPLWYEIARMDWLRAAGFCWEEMHALRIDPAMVNLNLNYKAALRYPGRITVRTSCLLCEPKKLRLRYEIYKNGAFVTDAESFHIWVKNADKSCRLDEEAPDKYAALRAAAGE